ncbi:glycoside hydrolase family 3 N-terminal domain-containing protein [Echinicola salinicaeni]|uniref:glycoside hydrolase family 3 N-terminal domain-containing protein n=1 Tax=Echinicola salinicaeni TaxID=2762757 RepID=UPI0016444094|nr:glycoside hydrolase family 3 N-terminal domain-containing protein [Echinicola salinicaeni]
MNRKVWVLILLVFAQVSSTGAFSEEGAEDPFATFDIQSQTKWVDSVFYSHTFEERLGQLFMVAAYSNKGEAHKQAIAKLIQEQQIGGLIFFQGGPVRQANLTNYYQSISKTPLFIAMDAEWGVSMRLDSVLQFPKQMTLGAIQDDRMIYKMGEEIAHQFKELGMHINFAPVVDVNANPDNPVIGYRAFGEQKENVANKSVAYMKGLQENGVIANAKHFPGHGDTNADSHYTTPVIKNSSEYINDIDLYPYRKLIDEDLMSVMVAHLHIPSLGTKSGMPTTLSKNVVSGLLKEEMGFKGLVFTDALNMKGVSNMHKPGEVDLLALLAGNDILLYAEDVPKSKRLILQAVEEGRISQEEIDARVRKILRAKYWAGLNKSNKIETGQLVERISNYKSNALIEDLYAASMTLARNEGDFLPIKNQDLLKMASITLGNGGHTFQKYLDKYGDFKHFRLPRNSSSASYNALEQNLKDFNTVVVGVMNVTNSPRRNFGIKESDMFFIKKLSEKYNVVTVLFGNAYAAKYMDDLPNVLVAYEENDYTEKLAPQIIFGARPVDGVLPATVSDKLRAGTSISYDAIDRLGYSSPESVGMDSKVLNKIDNVVNRAIARKSTPGACVLVAKNGKVVFEKAYGHLDYNHSAQVTDETIYDLASITKVMSTTQSIMFLTSRGLVDLERPLGFYLPELEGTNKADLKIQDVLMHEAGLQSWIPFYTKTLTGGKWSSDFYRTEKEPGYTIKVAEDMYATDAMPDSLFKWVVESDLRRKPYGKNKYDYKYSDLGMYLLQRMIEKMIHQPVNEFLSQNFYQPLGLNTLTYLPLEKFDSDRIAPTENDRIFRKQLVRGYVHDPGAAMFGGVAGHAGLFGTAHDLAVMMQMMLQGGEYGGVNLLDAKTVKVFTQSQSAQSRRALGWDRPDPEPGKGASAGKMASKASFGHTGFTGTAVWADPEEDLIYVFLSNRVNPNASNNSLLKFDVRTDIHDIIYQSMTFSVKNYALNEQN